MSLESYRNTTQPSGKTHPNFKAAQTDLLNKLTFFVVLHILSPWWLFTATLSWLQLSSKAIYSASFHEFCSFYWGDRSKWKREIFVTSQLQLRFTLLSFPLLQNRKFFQGAMLEDFYVHLRCFGKGRDCNTDKHLSSSAIYSYNRSVYSDFVLKYYQIIKYKNWGMCLIKCTVLPVYLDVQHTQ